MGAIFGTASDPGAEQVEDLDEVQEQRDAGHYQHEDDKDGLLSGSGHVALDSEGTGLLRAGEHGDHDEAIQVVLSDDEGSFNEDLDNELSQVASQQVPLDLHLPIFIGVFGPFKHQAATGARQLLPQLGLLVDDVHGVAQVHQRRCGHEDDLENPEANVRDGEGPVVADVLTTRLLCVTDEARLLVAPDALSTCTQDHDPEEEEDTHPDLPNDCGVGLDLIQ